MGSIANAIPPNLAISILTLNRGGLCVCVGNLSNRKTTIFFLFFVLFAVFEGMQETQLGSLCVNMLMTKADETNVCKRHHNIAIII